MPLSYPRKQTVFIFIICAIAVGGTIYFTADQNENNSSIAEISPTISAVELVDEPVTNEDWKSAFGENVSTNSATESDQFATAIKANNTPITSTDKLGREFLSKYIEMKGAGVDSTEVATQLANDLINENTFGGDKPKFYTISQIIITKDTGIESLKRYGNQVGTLITTYAPTTNEVTLAYQGLQNEDYSFVKEAAINNSKYEKILNGLLTMGVPESLAEAHLNLVNGMSNLVFISSSLKSIENDPIKTLAGISQYQPAVDMLFNGVQSIKNMFVYAGISYNNGEGGEYFKTENI